MRHQSPEKKKETGGVLRDILVIEDEGIFNVAFLTVNRCHSDNLHSGAEVPAGWNVFIYLHGAAPVGQSPNPVFGWEAHVSMVRHEDQDVLSPADDSRRFPVSQNLKKGFLMILVMLMNMVFKILCNKICQYLKIDMTL